LVHDLTNIKSQENLKYWLTDVIEQNENISICTSDISGSTFQSSSLKSFYSTENSNMPPLLVIGTKLDSAQSLRSSSHSLKSTSQIALNFRADEINLVSFKKIIFYN
jgi:hypothetical protein